jgi:hypothetical protein
MQQRNPAAAKVQGKPKIPRFWTMGASLLKEVGTAVGLKDENICMHEGQEIKRKNLP